MPRILTNLACFSLFLILASGSVAILRAQALERCPAGTRACGVVNCCAHSQICSADGHCYRQGLTYCGNGNTCPQGQLCTDNGLTCAPAGSTSCGPGVTCAPGTVCRSPGVCAGADANVPFIPPERLPATDCPEGQDCLRPGWFRCEDTGSQCRPGFKCSRIRGCVPVGAVDCGEARWCRPGEICRQDGGCAPAAESRGNARSDPPPG